MGYEFDAKKEYGRIRKAWREWANETGLTKFALGISGGKDSTFLAYMAKDEFGPKNVIGVSMPNGAQPDISDVGRVFDLTGIRYEKVNIAEAYSSIAAQVGGFSQIAKENLPPRLRMAALFAVAQTNGAAAICTDNKSENCLGYSTFGGDGFGSYAPIRDYTATEVVAMGKAIGIPDDLICKKPGDGLQALGDEDRFGFTYAALDALIREDKGDGTLREKVIGRYRRNKFKTDIVNIPGPASGFPDFVTGK